MPSKPPTAEEPVPAIPAYAEEDILQKGMPDDWKPTYTDQHPIIHLADPNRPIEPSEDRSQPYVLRGRHAEFNRLAQLLENPPRAVHLITGPPGSGKSALLKALREYAQKTGYITVLIEPQWFTEKHTLIKEIRKATLGEDLSQPPTKLIRYRAGAAGVSGGVNLVAHAAAEASQQQSQTEEHDTKGNPVLLQNLQNIIQQLQTHHKQVRGIFLYCDEFQNLKDISTKELGNFETTRRHLETLNEGLQDTAENLPIITLLAGIPPAEDTLIRFLTRKSSANVVDLLPVDGYPVTDPSSTYCTQIIWDYIERGQAIDGHELSIDAPILHRWGLKCEGHVVHANHAGSIIQNQLREWHLQGNKKITPDDLPIITEQIKLRRIEYYKERHAADQKIDAPQNIKQAARALLPHLTFAIVEQKQANHPIDHPTFLTWETIEHLSEHIISDSSVAGKALELLIHTGVIRKVQPGSRFARYKYDENAIHHDYIDAPILTMTDHIVERIPMKKQGVIYISNEKIMATYDGFLTTQCQWKRKVKPVYLTQSYRFKYESGRQPCVLTPAQAEEAKQKVQDVLQNRWHEDMLIHSSNKKTEGWLDMIHNTAPEEVTQIH